MTLDDALHVNDAMCYFHYCKSPLRYCLNTGGLIMLHVGGYNVPGEVHTSLSILIVKIKTVLLRLSKSIRIRERQHQGISWN